MEPATRNKRLWAEYMRWFHFRFLRAWRQQRRRSHEWMSRHPRCARWLTVMGCLRTGPDALARGVGIGLLIGLTPTVGAQIILMILCCTLLRGNFLAAFALSWITNPITIGPLYYGFNQIGEVVFAPLLAPLAGLTGLSGDITEESITAFLGSLVLAIPAAIIGYAVTLWALHRRSRRKGNTRIHAAKRTVPRPIMSVIPVSADGSLSAHRRAERAGPEHPSN